MILRFQLIGAWTKYLLIWQKILSLEMLSKEADEFSEFYGTCRSLDIFFKFHGKGDYFNM